MSSTMYWTMPARFEALPPSLALDAVAWVFMVHRQAMVMQPALRVAISRVAPRAVGMPERERQIRQ